jgi:hypothetical protein
MRAVKHRVSIILLAALACSFALVATGVWAQNDPRYPWDRRPERCFQEPGVKAPECVADHWPSFDVTVSRLAFLYQSELFQLLERALADITSSRKQFDSGYTATSAAYWTFRALMNGGQFDPSDRDRIARWRKAVPNSYFSVFAEARFLYANAWNIRGSGFAGSVSKESWELFAIRLQESERVLLNAPRGLMDTPLWHQLLLAIVLDTDQTQSNPEAAFTAAVEAWPSYFQFYEVILTRLTPKWGGNWGAVESFIDHWAKQQAASEGDSLYARLYVSVHVSERVAPELTLYNWVRMKKSFEDLIARYPDPVHKNRYASYACVARDKSVFGEAMRQLPAIQIDRNAWLHGHSYEACMRWAGI